MAAGNASAQLTIDALTEYSSDDLDIYSKALQEATATVNPAYGLAWYGERYREVASDPDWFIGSLVDNAFVEGEGARKLWVLSAECTSTTISKQVKRHAIDESRHAQYYIHIIDIIFPGSIPDHIRPQLDALSPRYLPSSVPPAGMPAKSTQRVIDEIVQMNIGEIRTRINQLLLRPVAHAYCGENGDHDALQRVLDRLMRDETRHIHYTADIIEQFSREGGGALVHDLIGQRMHDFNAITLQEVGEDLFDGS
ncbi:hypothetical protein [Streptomyces sp. DSM 41634]|uniref:hypothetical protein n=1 Tax=Streptomyces sp. DSM 41634 TaxID=3448656 RepID=UPI00403FEDBD